MKPSAKNNQADFGFFDWYGYGKTNDRFVFAVFGSVAACFDGTTVYLRVIAPNKNPNR